MISISKYLTGARRSKAAEPETLFQTTLECYLAAISAMSEHAVEFSPELTKTHEASLLALQCSLSKSPGIDELIESRAALIQVMVDYRYKAVACLAEREEDLRAVLSSLVEVVETVSGNNERHSGTLKKFTQQLQVVAQGFDLSQMRRELEQGVMELKATQDQMIVDNSSLVADMQMQLATFQERLESTEKRASTDALTGLLNRGEGEARLVSRLAKGRPVSALLIDLDDFKQINDRFGHVAGDQVLNTFGQILTRNLCPTDSVCRWGGDEFLVLMMTLDKPAAEQRAAQLREQLRIRCKLVILGKVSELDVSASVGVATARADETTSDLLTRADMDLYRQKRERKKEEDSSYRSITS